MGGLEIGCLTSSTDNASFSVHGAIIDIQDMKTIQPSRMELIQFTPALIRMEVDNHATLSMHLNAVIPPGWPPVEVRDLLEYFARSLEERDDGSCWSGYYWIASSEEMPRTLVGSGGFKNPPGEDHSVELGYGTLEIYRNRGFATQAVKMLVKIAASSPEVEIVYAEALDSNTASKRVLHKAGFIYIGDGYEKNTSRFRIDVQDLPNYQ